MADETIKRILVELDCLLDTRIAVLNSLSPLATKEILKSGAYRDRKSDDFELLTKGVIKNSDFINAYAKRNKETLKRSQPTNIVKLLSTISKEVELQKLETPVTESLKIIVNVFPYKLTEDEIRILSTAVMCYGGMESEVTVTNKSLKELSPTEIKKSWDGLIIYEFDNWFTLHSEALDKTPIPRHLMFAPALYIKPIEEKDEVVTTAEGGTINPFTVVEMAMVAHLCLELLRPEEFSLIKLD